MTKQMKVLFRFFREICSAWKRTLKLYYLRASWRIMNPHNQTIANTVFDPTRVTIGRGTYGHLNVHTYGNPEERLTIGNYCSIAGGVHFILSGGHNFQRFSSYPFRAKYGPHEVDATCKGPIVVEDDVWIGYGAIILSGVTIKRGAVIAAGSVVSKDIPPYGIWVANKVRSYRFDEKTIEKLTTIDFEGLDAEGTAYSEDLLETINEKNVDTILQKLIGKK